VSFDQPHRCVYDFVRAGAVSGGATKYFEARGYKRSEDEQKAFNTKDIAALYQLGLHPVLLNGFCRVVRSAREDYRKLLEPSGAPEQRRGRWQK
jgi:hypothetical protein